MPKKDPRVDAYIARSADFAKPILGHLRKLAHTASPGLDETLKWGVPHFMHQGIVFGMAAFKRHCAVIFWKGQLIFGDKPAGQKAAMGQLGRITALSDLPGDKVLIGYIRKTVELNAAGVKLPARPKAKKKSLVVPDDLTAALRKNRKALATFENFSCSHQKEYVEWITGAKREETRRQRLATAVQWLGKGKSRNWKYQNC